MAQRRRSRDRHGKRHWRSHRHRLALGLGGDGGHLGLGGRFAMSCERQGQGGGAKGFSRSDQKGGGTKQHENGCSVARVRTNDSPTLDPLGASIQIWGCLARIIWAFWRKGQTVDLILPNNPHFPTKTWPFLSKWLPLHLQCAPEGYLCSASGLPVKDVEHAEIPPGRGLFSTIRFVAVAPSLALTHEPKRTQIWFRCYELF